MRLVVKIAEGPLAGAQSELVAGQVALVGRGERSDFVLAHDRYLSGRHMLLECTQDGCRVRDLNSTNGTWLNGTRVTDAELLDGDRILIGRTLLQVSITGGATRRAGAPQPANLKTVQSLDRLRPGRPAEPPKSSLRDRYNREDLERLEADESTEQFPYDPGASDPAAPAPPAYPSPPELPEDQSGTVVP